MSLPTIAVPSYDLKLHSRPKPVTFRPYLVREEKLLMMAQSGEDPKEIENAVKDLIRACTFDKVAPETLPSFDLEMLFLHLRARSVNNVITARFRCKAQAPIGSSSVIAPCDTIVPVLIDINDIKLTIPEGHTNKIWLTDEVGVMMKYPTAAIDTNDLVSVGAACIESVFTKSGEVTETAHEKPEVVRAFVEGLQLSHIAKLRAFFETMPRLEYRFDFACSKCGHTETVVLSGLQDFFG